jgi:hypothetical protein
VVENPFHGLEHGHHGFPHVDLKLLLLNECLLFLCKRLHKNLIL